MSDLYSSTPADAIAVIGMSGRFPDAPNIDAFWRNLCDGRESISRFSEAELLQAGVAPEVIRNPNYVPAAAVLADIEQFDAEFFRFTAREAQCTDPQHRLLLECAWEALESAAYLDEGFGGRIGVYMGAAASAYWANNLAPNPAVTSSVAQIQLLLGNAQDYIATRISYKLNLTGSSLTVNTACSTSLVAVHLACQNLLDCHCDIALAGGAFVQVPAHEGYLYHEGGIGSPDGRCRPFDAKAQGTVGGSGVGVVALRRLEDALKSGDTVHAVLLSSAVNNDGSEKVGFTAPSELGQAKVISEALHLANVSPDSITYVEAHGTGTPLGDPIEVAALTRVFRRSTIRRGFCALGSVKSNVGHLDEAAGIAGLIKTVLALRHRTLPPSLNFETPNPKLNLANSPFFVNKIAREWVADGPRRAGVSSFGIGGTNAHIVLEEAPPQAAEPSLRPSFLLLLSARTRDALDSLCNNLAAHIELHPEISLADVSFTLAVGRRIFPERRAIVCSSRAGAITQLRSEPSLKVITRESGPCRPVFLFPGQGGEGAHSGEGLYHTEPRFREAIDACAKILRDRCRFSLPEGLFCANPGVADAEGSISVRLRLFALEYALAVLLRSWGIEPHAMIGHGLGESVAATLAGVFGLEEALTLIAMSGRTTLLSKTNLRSASIPFMSNATGEWITPAQAVDGDYWANYFRELIGSTDGSGELVNIPDAVWIEAGVGRTLAKLIEQFPGRPADTRVFQLLPSVPSKTHDCSAVFATLGELWLAGLNVDWNKFFEFERRRRIPLPTYPFERRRYWVDSPNHRALLRSETAQIQPKVFGSPIDSWFYVPRWTRVAEPAQRQRAGGAWVVFADESGLGEAATLLLRQACPKVLIIRNGNTYSRLSTDEVILPFSDSAAHARMWQESDEQVRCEAGILYFGSAGSGLPDSTVSQSPGKLARAAISNLLALVQGIGSSSAPRKFGIITNNTQAVGGDEVLCAESATLWGATRVVAKEYPNLQCYTIDLDWSDLESRSRNDVAADVLAVVGRPPSNFAVRNGLLWELQVEPLQLAETSNSRIRERGIYLITGGLGSMGLAFAEYLARTARARLILASRSGLPSASTASLANNQTLERGARFPLLAQAITVDEIVRAAHQRHEVFPLSDNPELESLLNGYCSSLLWQFISSGLDSREHSACISIQQIRTRLAVAPKFQKFFELILELLDKDGIVQKNGDEIRLLNPEVAPPGKLAAELAARFPSFVPLADLLSHCARNYGLALSEKIPAISVLYPDGTSRWLDAAMERIPQYAYDATYLSAAADLVTRLCAACPDTVRILEVGGGTGNLTCLLADVIASAGVEYHFTDIGSSFVTRAKLAAEQRGLHNMRFGRFDISRPPEPQGFRAHSYDLVLGYNVVHATADLVQTTRHLRFLLAQGGGLILVETVNSRRWIDLIWGLAHGWWSFTDSTRRQSSPLLPLDEWEEVLIEAGFAAATAYPRESEARRHIDAGLIIAQATGYTQDLAEYSRDTARQASEKEARVSQCIKRMEGVGAEVCVIAADVATADGAARAIQTAEDKFGSIDGVIHTAGVLGDTPLIRQQRAANFGRVLAPKVDGTLQLAAALGSRSLDFFVMCSSMSSIEPIPGQFDYSAANSFLDSFAQFRAARSPGLTVAIDWGFWQDLGMIETANVPEAVKKTARDEILAKGWSDLGIEIFARILRSSVPPQLLVSPVRPLAGSGQFHARHEAVEHPILSASVREDAQRTIFSGSATAGNAWFVDEHRVAEQLVLPASAYLDSAVVAFWHRYGPGPVELKDVCFLAPMIFAEWETKQIRLVLEHGSTECVFRILSQTAPDAWQEHARGEILHLPPHEHRERLNLKQIETKLEVESNGMLHCPDGFWQRVESFSPHWRNVAQAKFGPSEGLARFELPPLLTSQDLAQFALHPALLDTATGFMAFRPEDDSCVPFSFRRVCVFDRLPSCCTSVFRRVSTNPLGNLVIAGSVVDATGNEIVRVEDYTLRRVSPAAAVKYSHAAGASGSLPNVQLVISCPGQLQTLAYRAAARMSPGPGEVEIKVRAAGLNFVEVLYALGMLPNLLEGHIAFGQECAGIVTRVASDVTAFKPGDEVIAYGPACFSLYTTVSNAAVALKPRALSFEQAAALPTAFLTAWYSLIQLGRLQAGERVLIHAAAGGVGLAAVRIAQWRGAEIFATAGSAEKRQFLRQIGVIHVMDSRSLLFAEEVRRITKGEGVDVVLNSLGGEFIAQSLALVRRHGRFLELGKRDIFRNTSLGLALFAKSIGFITVDIGPDLPGFREMWRELIVLITSGSFGWVPHQTFAAAQVQDAFKYMAQARHIGKLVLSFEDREAVRRAAREGPSGLDWEDVMRSGKDATLLNDGSLPGPSSTTGTAKPVKQEHLIPQTEFYLDASSTERRIATVWEELLGAAPIGVEDDFFELNGDSLLAAQVMSRLQETFGVKLPLSFIFDYPTIRTLAAQVDSRRHASPSIAQAKNFPMVYEEGTL